MSSQANSPGTVATRPSAAAGSATAWSIAILGRVGQTSSSRSGDGGQVTQRVGEAGIAGGQQVEQHAGADDEHPGVPAIGAGGEIGPRHLERRLLHELLDHERAVVAGECRALADVAERRGRPGRRDADGDQPVVTGHVGREGDGAVERLEVADHVVGGERPHHHVGVLALEQGGGVPDRRHGVAGRRLGDHACGRRGGPAARPPARGARRRSPPARARRPWPQAGRPSPGAASARRRSGRAGTSGTTTARAARDACPEPPAGTTAQKWSIAGMGVTLE